MTDKVGNPLKEGRLFSIMNDTTYISATTVAPEAALPAVTIASLQEAFDAATCEMPHLFRKIGDAVTPGYVEFVPHPSAVPDWTPDRLADLLMDRIESDRAIHKDSLVDVIRMVTGHKGE